MLVRSQDRGQHPPSTRRGERSLSATSGSQSSTPARRISGWVCGLISALLLAGCNGFEAADPLRGERILSIDSASLARLLERTIQLEGTPLARQSRLLLAKARSCQELWGRFEAPTSQRDAPVSISAFDLDALDCLDRERSLDRSPGSLHDLVAARRAGHAGLLVWPLGDDGHVEITLDADSQGGIVIEGVATPPSELGGFELFVPGEEPPAAPAITPSATLVHLRMRPAGGIKLSSLIPPQSQADRLFALKGRLLQGALLAGTWELAFVAPTEGRSLPLAVGALHHRLAAPTREAVDEALNQLEQTWPIRRTPQTFETADGSLVEGGCFVDLPLLPELAPCWVVTPEALIVGYRDDAIHAALAAPDVARGHADGSSVFEHGLDLHLDRLAQVDRRRLGSSTRTHPSDLFTKLTFRMAASGHGRVAIHARLAARP